MSMATLPRATPGPVGAAAAPGRRVLWTLPYLPWPTTSGGKTRQHALLRQLAARGHRITLLALVRDTPEPAAIAYLESFLEEVVVVRRRSRTAPDMLLRAALSLQRPAIATVNGCNAEYGRRFEAQLDRGGWDIVQVEHSYGFEPLDRALARRGQPFLLGEHNVESRLVGEQYARLPGALRWLGRLDAARARAWESRVMRRATCVVAITPDDAAAFRQAGAAQTAVVVNGIDTARFRDVARDVAAHRLLFLGNFDYAPNVAAVVRLCTEIMPRLWLGRPGARLLICGHAMPAEWRRRWSDPRIEFRGRVAEVAEAHAACSAFIAPLASGGGSKLKVLEAMASGLPLVGTAEALSGLAVTPGVHYLGGETAEELAAAALRVLEDQTLAEQLGKAARHYAVAAHDWTVTAAALEQVHADHVAARQAATHG